MANNAYQKKSGSPRYILWMVPKTSVKVILSQLQIIDFPKEQKMIKAIIRITAWTYQYKVSYEIKEHFKTTNNNQRDTDQQK